jgi:hypothetical protein
MVLLPLTRVLKLLNVEKDEVTKFMAILASMIPTDLSDKASIRGTGRRIGHLRDIMSLAAHHPPMTIFIPGDEIASYYNRDTVRISRVFDENVKKVRREYPGAPELFELNPESLYEKRPWQLFRELCCSTSLCQTLISPVLMPDVYTQNHDSSIETDGAFQPLQEVVLTSHMIHQRRWYTQRPRMRPREANAGGSGSPPAARRRVSAPSGGNFALDMLNF